MATFINADQPQFRGRNDDGNQTTATWIAALNTNWSQNTDANFRLRITMQAQAGAGITSPVAPTLWVSKNGGAYTQVTSASSVARLFTSSNVTDLTATTQQISSGLGAGFAAGSVNTSTPTGTSATITAGGNPLTEHEWCLQIRGVDVSNADTLQFEQRTSSGGVLSSYTVIPSLTVVKTAPPVSGNFLMFMAA